jgi:GDP-mannose transporter
MAANQSYAKVPGDEEEEKYNNGVEATNQIPTTSTTSPASMTNSPMVAILSYCGSSILMTVTNKYVLGGRDFNLNFFLLCVQVCRNSCNITYSD